jgi:hypothetical protein
MEAQTSCQLSFDCNALDSVGKRYFEAFLALTVRNESIMGVLATRVRQFNISQVHHISVLDAECKLHSNSSFNFPHRPLNYSPLGTNACNYLTDCYFRAAV